VDVYDRHAGLRWGGLGSRGDYATGPWPGQIEQYAPPNLTVIVFDDRLYEGGGRLPTLAARRVPSRKNQA
jgi:hypothetical protein